MTTEKKAPEGSVHDSAEDITGEVIDVAARFLATLDDEIRETPITPAEARKVLWKIDLSILPIIWISTIVAAVDKVVISNAAIYGMKDDTHLVGNQYAWVGRYMKHFSEKFYDVPLTLLDQHFLFRISAI